MSKSYLVHLFAAFFTGIIDFHLLRLLRLRAGGLIQLHHAHYMIQRQLINYPCTGIHWHIENTSTKCATQWSKLTVGAYRLLSSEYVANAEGIYGDSILCVMICMQVTPEHRPPSPRPHSPHCEPSSCHHPYLRPDTFCQRHWRGPAAAGKS